MVAEIKEKGKFPSLKDVTETLEWKDIDHETYRVYIFQGGDELRIEEPSLINISASGGHRILTKYNISYYIPYKWIAFFFETDDNVAWRF